MYFRNPVLKSKQVCGDKWLSDLWISSESAFIYFSFLFLKHLLETNRESIACSIPFKFHSRLSAFLERTKSTSHIDLFSKCFSGLSTRKNTFVFGKVCFATEPFPLWHNKEGEARAPNITNQICFTADECCHARNSWNLPRVHATFLWKNPNTRNWKRILCFLTSINKRIRTILLRN